MPRKDEIKSKIASADGFPNFGVTEIFINPRDYSTKDRFIGISYFNFVILDGRVARNEVNYQAPPTWQRLDDFMAKVADSFALPPAADWAGNQNLKTLKCGLVPSGSIKSGLSELGMGASSV